MQSIFRLPYCSPQSNMSEKAALDKMRPSPVVEIPLLSRMKRRISECSEASSSPMKKQRPEVEYPLQLLTPSSPYAHPRMFQPAEPAQSFVPPNTTSHRANASFPRDSPDVQTVGGAEQIRTPLMTTQPQATKERVDSGLGQGGYFMPKKVHDHTPDMAAQAKSDPLSGLTPLQQVIENELNMQILMKHNELRLIDQELAKCQIALEQLRRCQLRPFPGSSQPASSVSAGTGPAIIPPPGFSRPSHPPPYGVTDGPYSQHYRRWLLQDPLFDSLSPRALAHAEHPSAANRSTRNNGHVRKTASKSLGSSRGSDALHSIPNYPAPQPKDKNAPLVLRRSTDNQLVKLICNDCKRGNFSSIQGFLNHCRIAHKVDYKSHDAAAVDCGQLLEEHEMANLPLEIHTSSAPKPAPARTPSVLTAPISSSTFVHPFNTPAATPVNTPGPRPKVGTQVATPMPSLAISTPQSRHNASFKPSSAMPRLSALFTKHRVGGDLQQAVSNATQKVDLSIDDDAMSPDTPGIESPLVPFPAGKRMPPNGAGVMRPGTQDGTVHAIARPQSRKGFRQPTQRPRPAPLAPAHARDHHMSRSTLSSPHDIGSAGLSPNAADSNPGLVSDHEDDDHASASDEESPPLVDAPPSHSIQPVGRPCEDAMDIDVEEDDELDQHGVIIRRNSMIAAETRGYRAAGSPSRKVGGK